MDRKITVILLLISVVLLSCGAGCANWGGLGISGKMGTLGLGGELTTGIAQDVNARVGFNTLDLDLDEEVDDTEYDIGLDFSSFSALVDWHVFHGSFRISGGVISMDHEFDLEARGTPGETEDIGDTEYDWAVIDSLSGSVEFDDLAPYVGIGWGDTLGRNKRWGLYFDLGVAFAGSPDIKLSSTGAVAAADLIKERDEIEDDLDILEFYPVLSIGLFYRF